MNAPGFFEDYFDDKPDALKTFSKYVNEQKSNFINLERLIFYSELTGDEDDNIDFSAVLSDGRTFTFTASTPTNIVESMQSAEYSDLPAWIEEGMVLVRRIDEPCIRYAVERCIELGIEKYGVLSTDPYD